MSSGEEVALLPAAEQARRVASGVLSPVDLLDASLARVERFNPELNAIVTLDPRAHDAARKLERRIQRGEPVGPLAGVVVGIKDVTEVAGLRTTYGSPLFTNHVPEADAHVVARLRSADAIILGKTNTPEFAAGGNTYNDVFGRTRNPWDPDRSAGGSTGGGAAALASGMIGIAQGTDLGGSLRIPASFCGVVGLRPSVGLVPTVPQEYLWDTLQVTGTMGRTAEDVALSLGAICEPTPASPLSHGRWADDLVASVRRGDPTQLRLAYCRDIGAIGVDPEIQAVCDSAVLALQSAGARVDLIDFDLSGARQAYLALRGLWFVSQLYPYLDQIDSFGSNVSSNLQAGLEVTTHQLAAAEGERRRMWERFQTLFRSYHHLLTPTMAVPPFPVEENFPRTVGGREMSSYMDWLAPTFLLSMTGLPVGSVPCGLDPGGLPVGLQIVGRPRAEGEVLATAGIIEALCPLGSPPRLAGAIATGSRTGLRPDGG
ncbi:amidase [soil metagenome]